MYKLIIEDDEGKTTVVPLIRDEITIGRKEGNTIRLTERNVSRRHAKLVKSNGSVFIEDLTSYNGIKVNGDRIAGRAPVNEGDRVQIGDYQLALKLDKAQAAAQGTATAGATAPAMPSAAPSNEMLEQKTTPFLKENGAAPAAMLDMAPTVQTPIQPTQQGAPPISGQQEAPARLVVVSSNFAGQEFVLDKAAVVIGRTDENDVVINHRSISRHHAKIVREAGHYHIVDLQSANGVRVNGEEYGKVELRKGDHVDLGHVRLRFVAPGEDFIFDRDAQVVDVSGAKKSRTGLVAVLMLVLIALAGGAFVLVRMTQKPNGGGGGGDTVKTSGDVDGAVARLLLEADKAMKAEDWETASAKCDEALKLDPSQELARDKRQHAEAERKNRAAYNAFMKAAAEGDWDSAAASYSEVAEDSTYRQKGSDKYAQVKKQYLRQHLDAAKKAKAAGKCEEARQHIEAALTVDEGNTEAQEILKSCGAVAKPVVKPVVAEHHQHAEKNPNVSSVPAAKVKEKPTSEEPPSTQPNPAAEKMLQDAQDAYVHGQYANAIETAKRASKSEPLKAWRIIGAASCFLKDRTGAMQAWNKLGPQERSFLKYVCSRNAITVP
ncbi:MAG TPA: FHA domain-containing protein [Polyangia bacterium]|nr:FHA domain-containing protein [Polyangia bacterium]